ncbi:MAG: response regulator [Saprospiraceae bacterium]
MKILGPFFFLLLTTAAQGQQYQPNPAQADSLRRLLLQQPDDTTQLKLLVALKYVVTREEREAIVLEAFHWLEQRLPDAGRAQRKVLTSEVGIEALLSPSVLYQMRGNEKRMVEFAQQAVRLAENSGKPQFLLQAKAHLLFSHMAIGNVDAAIQVGQAIEQEMASKETPDVGRASFYALMHECYRRKGDLLLAADWSNKMMTASISIPDKLNAQSELAQDYIFLQEYDKALEAIEAGLQLAHQGSKSGDLHAANTSKIDMRIQSLELNQKAIECWLAKDSLSRARTLSEQCLAQANEIGAPVYLCQAYHYMGNVELKDRNYPKAIQWYKASMELSKEKGVKQIFTNTVVLTNLGVAHLALGDPEKALEYAKEAETSSRSVQFAGLHLKVKSLLADIYRTKGQYAEALYYFEDFIALRDSVNSIESNRALIRQQMQYEFDQREEARRQTRIALLASGAFLALLVVFFWQRTRLKQRALILVSAEKAEANRQRRRAEVSEAFKSRFLANMSHEIRTPLHGISGFTDLLLESSLNEKQRHWLSSIHHSTDRLGEVVNDILDFSKLEAGEVKLRQVPFSPARLAADVQEALSLPAEKKGIELTLKVDENVPEAVFGDPTRLYQILMNLVGNAVKFTEKGQVELAVAVGSGSPPALGIVPVATASEGLPTSTANCQLKFTLADTGIGIPSDKISAIFDSFQQAGEDTTARFGGTGLGLTIARELVQLYGSDIKVESELGKGSTFSFDLNLPLANAADLDKESIAASSLFFDRPLRILLADDNALNREIATEAIRRHFENAEIVEAVNGKEAVEQMQNGDFDLVLMDMQMPEMTGTEATRYIRQHISTDIPIIALTASTTPEEIENALESGMTRHLGKPFKPRELARPPVRRPS